MSFCTADGNTASACEIRGNHGIPRKRVKFMIFMEKCGFHVKITRKQPFVPEAENNSKRMPFCMVGRPFGCFWGQNGEIH